MINQFEKLGARRAKLTGSEALNTYPGSQNFSTVWPVNNFIELGTHFVEWPEFMKWASLKSI